MVAVYMGGQEVHAFTKFYVADLEEKIYKLERGEEIVEEEDEDDEPRTEFNKGRGLEDL